MKEYIISVISTFSTSFFICQFVTILILLIIGYLEELIFACIGDRNGKIDNSSVDIKVLRVYRVLLAFPVGLSLFILASFVILCLGVSMKGLTIVVTFLIFNAALIFAAACAGKAHFGAYFTGLMKDVWISLRNDFCVSDRITDGCGHKKEQKCLISKQGKNGSKTPVFDKKHALSPAVCCIAVVLVIAVAVSGIISIATSNDSMYYFSLYPRAIAAYGKLRREFNVFLTDVGIGSALIGTLPYLFGFNETFGIQTFFNINFICLFAYGCYECLMGRMSNAKCEEDGRCMRAIVLTAVVMIFLLTCMPFIIESKWAMANVYFMEFMFIVSLSVFRLKNTSYEAAVALLITVLSLIRMEGGIFVLFLILCISTLDIKADKIVKLYLLPVFITQLMYDVRIFLLMDIDAPYTFLTKDKAILQLAAIVALAVYLLLKDRAFAYLSGRFPILSSHRLDMWAVMGGMIAVNILLLLKDFALYIGNLDAFYRNLFGQSGWGFFPMAVIALFILTYKKNRKWDYFTLLFFGFILMTFAVSWARGDMLRESLSDSGNRVLLQITPFALFAIVSRLSDLIDVKRS